MKLRLAGGGASVKGGGPPRIVKILTLSMSALFTVVGIVYLISDAGAETIAVPSPIQGDDKLAARGQAKVDQLRRAGDKLKAKSLGDDYQFDADGRLLGPPQNDDDLPSNRTLAEITNRQSGDVAEFAAIRSNVRHGRRYEPSAPEYGYDDRSIVASGSSPPPARERREPDRALLTQSMLAPPTVMPKREETTAVAGPRGDNNSRGRSVEEENDARALGMMERLQEGLLAQAESGEENAALMPNPGAKARSGANLYPAAEAPQAFPRGSVGDMRIASGRELVVRQGKFLDCVLVNHLRVDLAESPIICMVTRNFLSMDGEEVLFPAGAKVLGTAGVVQNLQQSRVYLKGDRIIFPDQRSAYFPVRQVGAVDGAGSIGIPGDVDRHFALQFGAAVMLGMLDGLAAAVQQPTAAEPGVRELVAARTSSNFATIVGGVLQRYANVVPTISVPPGTSLKFYFSEDVRVSPYMRSAELSWMRR
jgi:type IV secretory pathway VirB10-like protein